MTIVNSRAFEVLSGPATQSRPAFLFSADQPRRRKFVQCCTSEGWTTSQPCLQPVSSFRSRPPTLSFCRSQMYGRSLPPTSSSLRIPVCSGGSRRVGSRASFSSSNSSVFSNSLSLDILAKRVTSIRLESPRLCRSSLITENETTIENIRREDGGGGGSGGDDGGGGGSGGGGDAIEWISSILVFAFWAGLLVYIWTLSPDQTRYRDVYFLEKLVYLRRDDGFIMNKVLVAEWLVMGFWPLVYSSLLIPNGRSSKNGVKVGPFAVASFFLGAFALLPYFGLWRPPPPSVSRDELSRFPLNVLESKITAVGLIIGGIVLAAYAGFAGVTDWKEFLQYFRESRFIHIMSIDFVLLSALCPFWIYNDLSVRQEYDKRPWLLYLSLIPYLGPALYILLRPTLPASSVSNGSEE